MVRLFTYLCLERDKVKEGLGEREKGQESQRDDGGQRAVTHTHTKEH